MLSAAKPAAGGLFLVENKQKADPSLRSVYKRGRLLHSLLV